MVKAKIIRKVNKMTAKEKAIEFIQETQELINKFGLDFDEIEQR